MHDFTAGFAGKFPNEDHPVTGIAYPLGDRCDYYNKDRGWRNIDSGIIGDVMLRAVLPVHVADDPMTAVALGTGATLSMPARLRRRLVVKTKLDF